MLRVNVVDIFIKKNINDRIIPVYCVKLIKKCDHVAHVFRAIRQQEAEKKGNLSFLSKNEKKKIKENIKAFVFE